MNTAALPPHPRAPSSQSTSPPRQVIVRICAFSAFLTTVGVFATLLIPHRDIALRPTDWWIIPLLAAAFALAEATVFHFEFRREAMSFGLSEVPLAFALLYLPPTQAIAARLVGSMLVLALQGRRKSYKLFFNASLFVFETALAYHVVSAITRNWSDSTLVLVVALVPATALTTLVGSLCVSTVISLIEGGLRERIVSELRVLGWLAPMNALVAASAAATSLVSGWLVLLSLVPLVAVWGLMRSFGLLGQRLRDLEDLHGFVGLVGNSLDLDEVIGVAGAQVSQLLRVRHAAVLVFSPEQPLRNDVGPPLPDLPTSVDDPRWADVLGARRAQMLRSPECTVMGLPSLATLGNVLCAPVRDGDSVVGLIVVAGREGAADRLTPDDALRLQALADQIAPNLRKALLHHRIEFEARHDALTGLPNRSSFERIVDHALQHQPLAPDEFAVVMLMDLDRFKEVNDTLGHHAGDAVLNDFARRLSGLLGPGEVLARLAGDEFALLTFRTLEGTHAMAAKLLDEARQPFVIDGLDVVVTMSIGVAPAVHEVREASSLLRQADIAMYTAKNRHSGYELYSDTIDRRTPARLSMLGDLRNALEGSALQVFLQPKLDLASGVVIGVEALARWSHPRRGWVAPEDFVPVAEETGLIKQLTDQVLEASVAQLRQLRGLGHHLGLAVNLSTHDLLDELLPERVMRHLDRHEVDPTLLTLEITESSLLIDAPRARTTIERLNQFGVRLSVDDFGTGYSSLSYLRHLPVSELKIDRSFVANVLFDEQDEVIVRSIIDLGHNLGMQVVAEGVETDEVLNRLRGFACDVAQGFGICRPVPLDSFVAWLSSTQHPSRRRDPLRPGQWFDHPFDPATDPATEA